MATATPGGATWIPDDTSEIIRSNDFPIDDPRGDLRDRRAGASP